LRSRIVALCNSLKPYQYLEGDSLTKLISPERGQLLISLVGARIGNIDLILKQADFSYADLKGVKFGRFKYANLSNIKLIYANLSGADLTLASLQSADLSYADLSYANFLLADLKEADLSGANLSGANLRTLDFESANLKNTTLDKAKVYYGNFASNVLNFPSDKYEIDIDMTYSEHDYQSEINLWDNDKLYNMLNNLRNYYLIKPIK
jgi:uncharacterized protein YjbI with pentapeptide repeats